MDHGLRLDEVKTGKMGGASAAKTCVLASEATLQVASLHLTASGGVALLADERVASPQACLWWT